MSYSTSITDRTKAFAIRVIKACTFLNAQNDVTRTLSRQLLRSGTSIAANIREGGGSPWETSHGDTPSQSAESNRDFIHKLQISLKETRETQLWLELLIESELVKSEKFSPLLQEANEIGKILVTSIRKLKEK